MIYKFRILSDEVDDFLRVFEVPDTISFYNFHWAMQKELDYDSSQIACFYLSNEEWEKVREFSLFDLGGDNKASVLSMESSILKDYLKEKKDRLLYVFDIFSERALFIELVEMVEESESQNKEPLCTQATGDPPQQIKMEHIEANEYEPDFEDLTDEFDDEDLGPDMNIEEHGLNEE